jgi:hypothetical protein
MKRTEDKECFLHGVRISPQMNDIADISLQVQKVVRIHNYVHHLQKTKKPAPKKRQQKSELFRCQALKLHIG